MNFIWYWRDRYNTIHMTRSIDEADKALHSGCVIWAYNMKGGEL